VEPTSKPRKVGSGCRVLLVGHYASERNGGEGSIPLRLFTRLRARGVQAWLLTHDSSHAELSELLPPDELERVVFASGLPGFGPLFTLGERLPTGMRTLAWGLTQVERQIAMVPLIRRLVRDLAIDVVHQPISVSPVIPSPLTRLGAPVVMGPLDGGMHLPPAFRGRDSRLYALTKSVRPAVASALNTILSGRRKAEAVLVANERTRMLLPQMVRNQAIEVCDIGVVLSSWPSAEPRSSRSTAADRQVRFLFAGRLVGWKGVDILLDAFAHVTTQVPAQLEIIGDGPERARLQAQAARLEVADNVSFRGWLEPQDCASRMRACDVFVSASLQEAGGIAVLEAMACGRPVIASAWGGHLATVGDTAGILVGVSSRPGLVRGLADAMIRLASDEDLRARLGAAGRRRVEARYDWDVLIEAVLGIYDQVREAPRRTATDLRG
jgi:glycosyltransferase involved in cell wall biosynthesis